MKRYHLFFLSLGLMLTVGLPFTGCGDELLPPDDDSENPTDPNKITLKGDLVLETPLPDDAKVVLVWGVSTGSPDYGYVYGRGTIDREANTFEIALSEAPPINAVNWWFRSGVIDTGFGAAVIAVVSESVPEGQVITSADDAFGTFYGMVDFSNVIYFSVDPDFWWQMDPEGCHDWTKQFDVGYRIGYGLEAADGCTFDGFIPVPAQGLKLIINSNPDRFTPVNWT